MSGEDIKRELKLLRKKSGSPPCDKEKLKARYEKAIAMLPPFEAQILRAYYIEGKTHDEIAGEIYYSSDTVRRIIKRGIDLLAKRFK